MHQDGAGTWGEISSRLSLSYTPMATNADQWKWRQIRISADQWKWRQMRISAVSNLTRSEIATMQSLMQTKICLWLLNVLLQSFSKSTTTVVSCLVSHFLDLRHHLVEMRCGLMRGTLPSYHGDRPIRKGETAELLQNPKSTPKKVMHSLFSFWGQGSVSCAWELFIGRQMMLGINKLYKF